MRIHNSLYIYIYIYIWGRVAGLIKIAVRTGFFFIFICTKVKFVVQGYTKKSDELWLTWLDYGPEMASCTEPILDHKTLQSISKSVQQLEVTIKNILNISN